MNVAIRIQNVSKQYRLGEVGTGTVSNDLERLWARLRGRPDPFAKVGSVNVREARNEPAKPGKGGYASRLWPFGSWGSAAADYVWALRDISFDVRQGEILGIVGRNGAGKSTLLKLLSLVTAPTTGIIKTKGRIASLLEVGTGFHPELTGRENVYLNGAILGMRRHEITRQLEEIVEFSGCAKYIDTPVKRYSSGMTVRLGFSVAAHLQCETLIVDEVLAVGDAEFQSKCMSRMQQLRREGRTVLFVSHNLASVRNLCESVAVLAKGKLQILTSADEGVAAYLRATTGSQTSTRLSCRTDRVGDGRLRWTEVSILDDSNQEMQEVVAGEPVSILCRFEKQPEIELRKVVFGVGLQDEFGTVVATFLSDEIPVSFSDQQEAGTIRLRIPNLWIRSGKYRVNLFASYNGTSATNHLDWIEQCTTLSVLPAIMHPGGLATRPGSWALLPGNFEAGCE